MNFIHFVSQFPLFSIRKSEENLHFDQKRLELECNHYFNLLSLIMDSIQTPVPTAPVAPEVTPVVPQIQQAPAVPQDDFIDKILKGIVNFIAKKVNKEPQTAPTVPLGVAPQQAAPNIFGTIGSTITNVANQAVDVAQNGVNTVVQSAQEYIATPPTPEAKVDVQDFLSQNYQSTPTSPTVETPPVIETPVAATEPTIPTPPAQ